MASVAGSLARESADKLVESVIEPSGQKANIDPTFVGALKTSVASTMELLASGKAGPGEIGVKLAVKNLKLLGLADIQAAQCLAALGGLGTTLRYSSLSGVGGLYGKALLAAFIGRDALEVYGECYIPAAEAVNIRRAEARAQRSYTAARDRARGVAFDPRTDAALARPLGDLSAPAAVLP